MRSEYPCMTWRLGNAEKLMRLQAESPARMGQTVVKRGPGVRLPRGAVHRLQEEVGEVEALVAVRLGTVLGIDQLELVACGDHQRSGGFRTHAQPVDSRRRRDRAVGLDRDLEAGRVECLDERG